MISAGSTAPAHGENGQEGAAGAAAGPLASAAAAVVSPGHPAASVMPLTAKQEAQVEYGAVHTY